VRGARARGAKVATAQLAHLNPLPANTGDVLRAYDRVLLPEMNTGQLAQVLRGKFLVDIESLCKVAGRPLYSGEIEEAIVERAGTGANGSSAQAPHARGDGQ
jgi:2-oxoglutarate ferredoxin oxidoreductase subunit alpha